MSLALPPVRSRSLASHVLRLFRLQWTIFFTGFKRARLRSKIGTLFLVLLGAAAFVGSLMLVRYISGLMASPVLADSGVDVEALARDIPIAFVSGSFFAILLTGFGLVLQALYLSNDMDFLLASPIPIRAVFVTKLLQAILPNLTFILLAGLPVLFGMGTALGYTPLFYPMVIVVLVFYALAAAGLSGLLVMVVVRYLPARRVAEVLGFIGAIVAVTISQWNSLVGSDFGDLTPGQVSAGSAALSRFNSAWSPLAWGGRGLVSLGEGDWLPAFLFLAITLGLSGLVFFFALGSAERLYYTGWASMQEGARRKPVRRRAPSRANTLLAVIPQQVRAIFQKDALLMRRDLRTLSQLVTPFIMGIVFAIMLLRSGGEVPPGRGEAPDEFIRAMETFMAYGSMAISLFVGWQLLSRLALISFSMEGRSYWILKSAPLSISRLLMAKFLMAYLPALAVSWLFLLVIAVVQQLPPAITLYGLLSVALVLAGLDGISLAFGVRTANFSWTDPRRLAGGAAGCLAMLAGLLYMGLAAALFFLPPIVAPALDLPGWAGQLAGLALGGTLALLAAFLPLRLVAARIPLLSED